MKILLIGESCIDEYVYGTCDRICPEAAALCFKRSGRQTQSGGMVANVLANLQALHPDIEVTVLTNKSTITKRRFVDLRYNTIVFRDDHTDSCDRIDPDFSAISFHSYDAIVFSDYCKGFLAPKDIQYISSQARPEAPKFIDTKKTLGAFLQGIDFVKINEDEYQKNCGELPSSGGPAFCALPNLKQALVYSQNLVVTCGRKGAKWITQDSLVDFPTEQVPVRDVCGAGDTFLAALVVQFLRTDDVAQSIRYANKMAARVVKKFGVAIP